MLFFGCNVSCLLVQHVASRCAPAAALTAAQRAKSVCEGVDGWHGWPSAGTSDRKTFFLSALGSSRLQWYLQLAVCWPGSGGRPWRPRERWPARTLHKRRRGALGGGHTVVVVIALCAVAVLRCISAGGLLNESRAVGCGCASQQQVLAAALRCGTATATDDAPHVRASAHVLESAHCCCSVFNTAQISAPARMLALSRRPPFRWNRSS